MHQRQTVVFGSIGTAMLVLLVLCTMFWLNIIPFPFNRDFTRTPKDTAYIPCLTDGAAAMDRKTISVRVYNAGETEGLASRVGEALTKATVTVSATANWAGKPIDSSVILFTSKESVASAYTLRAFFPRSSVVYDPTLTGSQVDVVLGNKWNEAADFAATPDNGAFARAMKNLDNCTPIADIPTPDA
ncbi:MAG: LytR C-terminal domain-containing protein [Actinomycetaceae bacterium]|nr:LytR C-terminal domain-containing protein [Actinomycetaceae bacterium]